MTEEEGFRVRYAVFEGRMPNGDHVGYTMTAGMHETLEMLEQATRTAIRVLEMKYPGVLGAAQLAPWEETVVPWDDDEPTEEWT